MRAVVEYEKEDIARLVARNILSEYGIKIEPKDVVLTTSKVDGQMVYEVNLQSGKKEHAK